MASSDQSQAALVIAVGDATDAYPVLQSSISSVLDQNREAVDDAFRQAGNAVGKIIMASAANKKRTQLAADRGFLDRWLGPSGARINFESKEVAATANKTRIAVGGAAIAAHFVATKVVPEVADTLKRQVFAAHIHDIIRFCALPGNPLPVETWVHRYAIKPFKFWARTRKKILAPGRPTDASAIRPFVYSNPEQLEHVAYLAFVARLRTTPEDVGQDLDERMAHVLHEDNLMRLVYSDLVGVTRSDLDRLKSRWFQAYKEDDHRIAGALDLSTDLSLRTFSILKLDQSALHQAIGDLSNYDHERGRRAKNVTMIKNGTMAAAMAAIVAASGGAASPVVGTAGKVVLALGGLHGVPSKDVESALNEAQKRMIDDAQTRLA